MKKLEHYLDGLLEDHLEMIESRKQGPHFKSLRSDIALRDLCTVRFSSGRQTGKSSYIARTATDRDIILCVDRGSVETMKQRRIHFTVGVTPRVYHIDEMLSLIDPIDDLWIDDGSYADPRRLDKLYLDIVDKCRRVIIIG